MTEKIICIILAVVLLALVFILPKVLESNKTDKQPTTSAQATTQDPYEGLDVLELEDYPTEVKFPNDYLLVYERMDDSNIVIIEKGSNYLVEDTAENTYGGLFVTKEADTYYYRSLQRNGSWGNKSVINRSGSSYMENELTKDRWEYPKKFLIDLKKSFKDSGKNIYISTPEIIGGIKCEHYIVKSAWFEYNYWVHAKTNVTLKYSKVEVRFGERNTAFEITAQKFTDKPSFEGYLSEELIPD